MTLFPIKVKTLFAISVVLMIAACNFSGKLTRRYKTTTEDSTGCNITNYVLIDASVIEKEPGNSALTKALHDLSDRGQAALINQVAAKETTSAGLLSRLKSDLGVPQDKNLPEIIDFTRMTKRILTTVRKKLHAEGDRIEKVIIKMIVNDENFKLRSCNRVVTEYMNVDLGKISYTNSNQFELSGNAGLGSEITNTDSEADKATLSEKKGDLTLGSERSTNNGITRKGTASRGINAKINASRSMSEEVQLRQRLVALNAFIKENTLYLYQEGISGIDLTGNILTDIVCEYINDVKVEKVYSIDNLFQQDGTASTQDKLEIKDNYIQSFNITSDITATITYEAVYRKILDRARTISEADDKISLISGDTYTCEKQKENSKAKEISSNTFVLIPKTTLRPNVWRLMYKEGSGQLPLHVCNGAGMCGEILFYNFSNAVEFLRWLRMGINSDTLKPDKPLGTKGYLLKQGIDNKTPPTKDQIESLEIKLRL